VTNLAEIPLFRACSKRELGDLARRAERVDASAGTVLVEEGAKAVEFFVITSGAAKVIRGGRTVAKLRPGDHFGELGVLADQRRSATVVATEDISLVVLARAEFLGAIAEIDTLSR